jgi:hypothetical protein
MNQMLSIRNLEIQLEKASREQLLELCLKYATDLLLQQNAMKEMFHTLAIQDALGDRTL